MSVIEILPIIIPISVSIMAFSSTIYCCLRRKVNNRYNILESRVEALEKRISSMQNYKQDVQDLVIIPANNYTAPSYKYPPPYAPSTTQHNTYEYTYTM